MFRGFRAATGARRRVSYEFVWLHRRPMQAVYNARTEMLSFPALLPGLGPLADIRRDIEALVASRSARRELSHKRVDARRARVTSAVRGGNWSLAVHIRGANHEYAVRRVLNLINELFLLLQQTYPEYLSERFGASTE